MAMRLGRNLLKVRDDVPYYLDDGDNPSFDDWMHRVDAIVWRCVGMSVYDLPDCPFRDWYDDRLRPSRAASRAVELGR